MDELVKQISDRTGLPPEQAKVAAQTVIDFLKTKLPEPIAGQIDGFINGGMANDVVNQASGMLGGLFGGNKQ